MTNRILIVEDEATTALQLRLALEEGGYGISGIFCSVNKAVQHLEKERPFLAIVDIYLKGELTGIHLAGILNSRNIPFIYVSANCSREILDAAKATNPHGFIVKPFWQKDLLVTIDIAIYRSEQSRRLPSRNPSAARRSESKIPAVQKCPKEADDAFRGIIGSSCAMMEIFDVVRQVAPLETSVLILGESGTGKEGIARAMHGLSPRHAKPFVRLNCAAIPEGLVESELFGCERGAFTGAIDTRKGKFEQADGGTLFLDEIGEMPLEAQAKLLGVLQERQIDRIGGDRPIAIDVRVIAATNRPLERMISAGDFRLDLYYRLNVFPIDMPPLRQRREDIPALVSHYLRQYAEKAGKLLTGIHPAALEQLVNYAWPGNIRELQNIVERSVAMAKEDVIVDVSLPAPIKRETEVVSFPAQPPATMQQLERQFLMTALEKCNCRVAGTGGAAEYLDLPPSTLYSKLKKLGISKKHFHKKS